MEQFREHTQEVSLKELFDEYLQSNELQDCLDKHPFIYVEGAMVLDTPQTIERKNGQPALTTDAREHLSGCALSFGIKLITLWLIMMVTLGVGKQLSIQI